MRIGNCEILTADEVATALNIHRRTVLRWAREGRVRSVRVVGSRVVRFHLPDVLAMLICSTSEVASPTS